MKTNCCKTCDEWTKVPEYTCPCTCHTEKTTQNNVPWEGPSIEFVMRWLRKLDTLESDAAKSYTNAGAKKKKHSPPFSSMRNGRTKK